MLELASALVERRSAQTIVVATVVRINGSAPRTIGSAMAVLDGDVVGSISGGCVEGAVYEACQDVAATGPAVHHFGYSDEDAFAVGLSCGGELDVLVSALASDDATAWAALERAAVGESVAVALVLSGPGTGAVLTADAPGERWAHAGIPASERARVSARLESAAELGETARVTIDCDAEPVELLVVGSATPPRMILVGAVDYSVALAAAAALVGYRVTVCDPRPVFADARRFPGGTDVVCAWPVGYLASQTLDARTVVCVLGHNDGYDAAVLQDALGRDLAYVGAMGSRRTHDARVERLRELGVVEAALVRLHSPIGLDLGASTPGETAVSVLAEIIAERHGRSGAPLRATTGSLHHAPSGIESQPAPAPAIA